MDLGLGPAAIFGGGELPPSLTTNPRQMHTLKMVVHVKLYGPWPQVVFPEFEARQREAHIIEAGRDSPFPGTEGEKRFEEALTGTDLARRA